MPELEPRASDRYTSAMSEYLKIDNGEGVWPPEGFTGLWEVYLAQSTT